MRDEFAAEIAAQGDRDDLRALLREVCDLTGMGFAAVARVTDTRWIACQVLDRIEFGLNPGEELELKTTICDDIRQSGDMIVIDQVSSDESWRTHHTPMLYGFESYASLPIHLADGSFYGTLCAIDPEPHGVSAPEIVRRLRGMTDRAGAILSGANEPGQPAAGGTPST
jgi:GAF domain-containing protein